jgi:hypothetical protein
MLLTFFTLATTVLATPSQDFSAAAAEAAKNAKADAGGPLWHQVRRRKIRHVYHRGYARLRQWQFRDWLDL